VIDAVEPMLRQLIGENVLLVVRRGRHTGRLRADRGQLDQILVNLVINARDAMPEGGTITIEAGNAELDATYAARHIDVTPGRYVCLMVRDTGNGMDAETREHAFEPFFTTKDLGRGTGLGLATIYGIMRQARGHVRLDSEPGVGSVFRLYFPRTEELGRSLDVARPIHEPLRSGRVLVVEDEASVRKMTTKVLRRAGYIVHHVATGAEAVERMLQLEAPIDVLVSDVVMPGMSGAELADRVFAEFPDAGVVLLSGYPGEARDVEQILRRGGIFLSKPVSSEDLLSAVARAVERRLTHQGVRA
jgi:two-component system cell cycle sensor histidine kinase/response regulator CckA